VTQPGAVLGSFMSLRAIATARKHNIFYPIPGAGRRVVARTTKRHPRTSRLCSGAGVGNLPTVVDHNKNNVINKVEASPTSIPLTNGRPTAREVVTELGRGAWAALRGIGTTFKTHPVISTAVAGGAAGLLWAYPLLGVALLAFGVGSSLWEVGKGIVELRKGMHDHSKAETDQGLGEVGQGLFGIVVSAIGAVLAGPAALGFSTDTVTHAADAAGSFNPGMVFHAVDDLPNLFAAASRVKPREDSTA
jgi:hypothetical protein